MLLEEGKPARLAPLNDDEWALVKDLYLLTAKPTIYAANVNEDDLADKGGSNPHVAVVREHAQEEGAEVIVVGAHPAGQKYTGKYGYPVKSHVNIEEFSSLTVDGLVLPGGFAPDYMRRNKHMLEAITTSIELGKPCAAICHGPWMFCSARFPNGQPVCHQRQCTSFVAIKDDLVNAGAQFVDAPVVVDGPLITARTPADLIPFCHALIEALM